MIDGIIPIMDTSSDNRYRILVLLQRSDRPRYYEFYCFKCQFKICELSNTDVIAAQDLIDYDNLDTMGVSVKCDGRYQGGRCNCHYLFCLSDRPIKAVSTHATITISGLPQ